MQLIFSEYLLFLCLLFLDISVRQSKVKTLYRLMNNRKRNEDSQRERETEERMIDGQTKHDLFRYVAV